MFRSLLGRRCLASLAPAQSSKQLAGTVPPHQSYIFLHSLDPPPTFPSRKTDPIQRALQLKTTAWGGVVNFSWSLEDSASNRGPEAYSLTAFSSQGRIEIPKVTLANIDEVEQALREQASDHDQLSASSDAYLYVCTHAARDCRCGDTGGQVVRALREEIKMRNERDPNQRIPVKVVETGHVGGHQYAANMLVFPHGEWLGQLTPEDVPEVLDAILKAPAKPFSKAQAPLCRTHWRGRTGLSKEEQIELHSRF